METIYIEEKQLLKAQQRNRAFWMGQMEEGPLMWVTAPGAKPSRSVPVLQRIQRRGKAVQLYYEEGHGGDADLRREIDVLARTLDPIHLFIWATVDSAEAAEEIVL